MHSLHSIKYKWKHKNTCLCLLFLTHACSHTLISTQYCFADSATIHATIFTILNLMLSLLAGICRCLPTRSSLTVYRNKSAFCGSENQLQKQSRLSNVGQGCFMCCECIIIYYWSGKESSCCCDYFFPMEENQLSNSSFHRYCQCTGRTAAVS